MGGGGWTADSMGGEEGGASGARHMHKNARHFSKDRAETAGFQQTETKCHDLSQMKQNHKNLTKNHTLQKKKKKKCHMGGIEMCRNERKREFDYQPNKIHHKNI